MRTQQTVFRLAAIAAIGGMVMGPGFAPLAQAQTPAAPAADGAAAVVDPPARVGRVARLLGTVSFHTADETEWQAATLNYPVTTGNDFWTEPSSGAEIEIDATHVALDQDTEFDVDTLDDHTILATTAQGAVYVRVKNMLSGDTVSITTPRGVVSVTAPGRYEVVAGDADAPTRLTVVDGAANIVVGTLTLNVTPKQTASVTGSDAASFQGTVGAAVDDPFLTAQLNAENAPPPPRPVATDTVAYTPPAVVRNMTGYDAVADTGEWQQTAEYGHVWYPPVQRDWVPYRHGHWAFVRPWGWTWVDDAAWGFAPFHYGRWVEVRNRWGWIPTEPGVAIQPGYVRPVYAPALVSFVAVAGAVIGAAAGLAPGGNVGWIPLGPREVYHPPFRASPNYIRNVNVTQVKNVTNITNVTNVTNTTVINNYINRGAATVVPAAAMTSSQPIAPAARPVTPQQLAAIKPVAQAPVAPTLATAGVSPAMARQMHIAPAANAAPAPVHPPAPGPAVTPRPPVMPAAVAVPGKPPVATPPGVKPVPAAAAPHANAVPHAVPQLPALPKAPPPSSKPAALQVTAKPAVPQPPAKPAAPEPMAKPAAPEPTAKPTAPPPAKPAAPEPMPKPAAPEPMAKPAAPEPTAKPAAPAPTAKPAAPEPMAKPTAPPPAKPAVPQPNPAAAPRPNTAPAPRALPQVHTPTSPPAPAPTPAPAPSPRPLPQVHTPTSPADPPHAAPTPQAHPAAPVPEPQRQATPAPHPAPAEPHRVCPAGQQTC